MVWATELGAVHRSVPHLAKRWHPWRPRPHPQLPRHQCSPYIVYLHLCLSWDTCHHQYPPAILCAHRASSSDSQCDYIHTDSSPHWHSWWNVLRRLPQCHYTLKCDLVQRLIQYTTSSSLKDGTLLWMTTSHSPWHLSSNLLTITSLNRHETQFQHMVASQPFCRFNRCLGPCKQV